MKSIRLVQTSDQPNKAPGVIGKAQKAIMEYLYQKWPEFYQGYPGEPKWCNAKRDQTSNTKIGQKWVHKTGE